MSSIPHNQNKENEVFDSAAKFISEIQIGKLLFKCNAGKEKGIPVMTIFRYLLCLLFSGRSDYMQRKTKTFEEGFSKNTLYRFLNSVKTNWQRFTVLLSLRIINDFMKPFTDENTKAQLEEFTSSFIGHLPKYMQDALSGVQSAA